MGFETLILLFVVFSVISSIARKIQEHRGKQEREGRPRAGGPRYPSYPRRAEPEIGPSDWEILLESRPEQESAESPSTVEEYAEPEFQSVRGARPVEEPVGGEEFRQVEATRPVTEPAAGEEFRAVGGKRPVLEMPSSAAPAAPPTASGKVGEQLPPERPQPLRRPRRAQVPLARRDLRRAIIYQEILGRPRAEHMPW